MKKNYEHTSNFTRFTPTPEVWRERRIQGAVLLLVSVASVVLSVFLLFGYATTLADRLDNMELGAQAYLSHRSSIDHAVEALTTGEGPVSLELRPISTAGIVSTFQISSESTRSSGSTEIILDGAEDIRVATCRSGVLAAGSTPDGILLTFKRPGSAFPEPGFPVTIGSGTPDAWSVAGVSGSGPCLGLLAFSQGGADSICLVSEFGVLNVASLDMIDVTDQSMITIGSHAGRVSAVVTDGTNRGALFQLEPVAEYLGPVVSAGGTCPVFLPRRGLYGELDPVTEPTGDHLPIVDVFTGDFDQDGTPDVAWAGPASLACSLSGSGRLMLDQQPGHCLTAWGFLEGRYGLGGLWESTDGRISWRKLLWSGFQQLPAAGTALNGYSGRIWSSGGEVAGIRDEGLIYAEGVSSEPVLVLSGGIPIDLDGSGMIDAVLPGPGLVTLIPDPTGTGTGIVRLTVTTFSPSGEMLLTDTRTVVTADSQREAGA